MTQAGLRLADKVILTADNPRSERAQRDFERYASGHDLPAALSSHYRARPSKAIEYAVQHAKA